MGDLGFLFKGSLSWSGAAPPTSPDARPTTSRQMGVCPGKPARSCSALTGPSASPCRRDGGLGRAPLPQVHRHRATGRSGQIQTSRGQARQGHEVAGRVGPGGPHQEPAGGQGGARGASSRRRHRVRRTPATDPHPMKSPGFASRKRFYLDGTGGHFGCGQSNPAAHSGPAAMMLTKRLRALVPVSPGSKGLPRRNLRRPNCSSGLAADLDASIRCGCITYQHPVCRRIPLAGR